MAKLKATSRFSSKGYYGPQLYGVEEIISKLESIGASAEDFAKQTMEETLMLYAAGTEVIFCDRSRRVFHPTPRLSTL